MDYLSGVVVCKLKFPGYISEVGLIIFCLLTKPTEKAVRRKIKEKKNIYIIDTVFTR